MDELQKRVKHNIETRCGVAAGNKIVVGLSGGADSIALTHILLSLGYHCVAAHCNFHLRGEESDGDEQFVIDICRQWDIKLHKTDFDTIKEAKDNNISIEMAARRLRYSWFESIITGLGFDVLAVGHHADDSAETFFLNLTRGTGVRGLAGIKYRNGNIVRPMLDIARHEVEQYCNRHNLSYVTDSTNTEEHYVRNKIRHSVMPVFKTINPSFLDTMTGNMQRLCDITELLNDAVCDFRKEAVATEDGCTLISNRILLLNNHRRLILFEILSGYGFTASASADILTCVEEERVGRQFYSPQFRIIVDRYNIVILPRNLQREENEYYIESQTLRINTPINLTIKEYDKDESFNIDKSRHTAMFDASTIQYPLTIRRWQEGDMFKPLGMEGFKKLSDYFTDRKFRLDQKENAWLLLSGNDIIWIIGERTDDRYKITDKTKRVLELRQQI